MIYTLEELAELTDSSLHGDKKVRIHSVAALDEAVNGQISFVSNPKYIKKMDVTKASAIILHSDLAQVYTGNCLINDDPYLTFARILKLIYPQTTKTSFIHPSAVIAESAKLHETVTVGANAVIDEEVSIGENVNIDAACYIGKGSIINKDVHLYPNVSIYNNIEIGEATIVHSGVVIGADGFGFSPTPDKKWFKILQVGNVVIGEDVEIGSNTTIDRAALGTTYIGNGVKLDSQIHIGHNVNIKEYTVIAAGTVIAGSTIIGERCQIGGAVAIAGHISVADDVMITGNSMVIKSIKNSGVYSSGITSDENKNWRKNVARFKSLDQMAKKIRDLEIKLNEK